MSKYQDLDVWKRAIRLVTRIYEVTSDFPRRENFGLTAQMRRAAVSVPSNIAEGQGRITPRDCLRFLAAARGSLFEVQTQLIIACNLGYVVPGCSEEMLDSVDHVARLLNGLIRSMEARTK